MMEPKKKLIWLILVSLLLLNFFVWREIYLLNQTKFLEVVFFDVGQGNAVLIKTPEGHYILIDAGPVGKGLLEKLAQEMPFWQKKIDLFILTHPHKDHFGGLAEISQYYQIEKIIWNGATEDSFDFQWWQDLITQTKSEIKISWVGQRIKGKDFSIDFLYPFFSVADREFNDANLSSLVLRLVFGQNSFLLMGDADEIIEQALINQEKKCQQDSQDKFCSLLVLDSDVLMVGHHGSKDATSEDFVKVVSPQLAVISVGENKFGQPHQRVLDTLTKYDIKLLRTDQNGDIKIITDGNNLKIKN